MLLIKYIMQASIPKIPKIVQDAIKRDQLEQAKKARTVSMRGKKDRRSQSFRRVNSIFVNRSEGLSPEPSLRWGLQEKQRSTRSILRNRNPDHNIGLTTIQSGEMSPASNDDTSRQSDKENENHVNTSSALNGVKTRTSLSESVASSHFDIPTPRHLPMEAEATPQPPRHDSQNVTDPVSECIKTAKSYEDEDVAMHRDDDLAYDEGIELLLNESDDETSLAMVSLSSGKRDSESANTLALQRIEARLSGLQSMRLSQELHEC